MGMLRNLFSVIVDDDDENDVVVFTVVALF